MNKMPFIGGIPHSEADRAEFQPIFEQASLINPKTGQPFVRELLADNNTLYQALYLLHKANSGSISNFKEEYKADILKKTGLQKRVDGAAAPFTPVPPSSQDFV